MNERAFRCPSTFILILALLLAALPGLVAADEAPRRISPRARAAFEAVAPPQAKECQLCAFAHQHCSQACFSLVEKGGIGKCLTQCDNAAATCTCDPAVGLRSEDLVSQEWLSSNKNHACNADVSCQPNYPSCASWSGYSTCDTHCFATFPRCGPCTCDGPYCWCERGPGGTEYLQRFRVCFDQFNNSCTEWQTTFGNFCGDC
jgi:hypothetical protein